MNMTTVNVTAIITAILIAVTSIIMTTLPAAARHSTINIIKDGTNSYVISGVSSSVGSVDTTYRIAGERRVPQGQHKI